MHDKWNNSLLRQWIAQPLNPRWRENNKTRHQLRKETMWFLSSTQLNCGFFPQLNFPQQDRQLFLMHHCKITILRYWGSVT